MSESIIKSIRSTINTSEIDLACGIVLDGKVYRQARVSSATAGDRKAFGDPKNRANGARMLTQFLRSKVSGFPGAPINMRDDLLRGGMLSFDRDQLAYEVRKLTVGDQPFIEEGIKCVCGAENAAEIETSEIESTFVPMPEEARLRIIKKGITSRCVFDVDLPDYGFKATFAYNDGETQERLSPLLADDSANPFEMDLVLISTLCHDWNGQGPVRIEDISDLDLEFVAALQDAMARNYGYNFSPEVTCYKCRRPMRVRVNVLDFLFPKASQKASKKRR